MELLKSKKFVALIIGMITNIILFIATEALGINPEAATAVATKITGLIASYCIGQGIADNGKEAAKIIKEK